MFIIMKGIRYVLPYEILCAMCSCYTNTAEIENKSFPHEGVGLSYAEYINGLEQDCSISSALAMEKLQSSP